MRSNELSILLEENMKLDIESGEFCSGFHKLSFTMGNHLQKCVRCQAVLAVQPPRSPLPSLLRFSPPSRSPSSPSAALLFSSSPPRLPNLPTCCLLPREGN